MIAHWFSKTKPPAKEEGTLQATDLHYTFTDDRGRKYYGFPATMEFPLERHARRSDIITYMASGLTGVELRSLIDIAITELENLVKGEKGSLVKVGAVLHEIKSRETLIVHHELLYQFIAIHYVREDENPYTVVDHVMDEKIEAFREMVAGGRLLDFFHLPELKNICNTIGLSSEEFQEQWIASVNEMKILTQKMRYLKSRFAITEDDKT